MRYSLYETAPRSFGGGTFYRGEKLSIIMRLPGLMCGCVFALAASFAFDSASAAPALFRTFPVKESHPHGIVYDPAGPLQGLWFNNRTTDNTSSVVEFDTSNGSEKSYL